MKFFVPGMKSAEDYERAWAYTRQRLSGLGLATTRRRIAALAYEIDGTDHYVAIGGDLPNDEDAVVMIILESSDLDMFYVCTPERGVLENIPYPVTLDERWRVIDFEEEVAGHA